MKRLNVFCNMYGKRLLVGRLAAADEGILFQYAESLLGSKLSLSPFKLPLQPGVFKDEHKTFDGLHGLFNDSLPDGWGLLCSWTGNSGPKVRASGTYHPLTGWPW